MVKKLLVIIIFIPLLLVNAKSGYEHDVDICGLFYDETYADKILNSSIQMNAICSATFLTLDYNSNRNYLDKGKNSIDTLFRVGVTFPFYLESLHVQGDGSSDHEKYTHMGWEPYRKYNESIYNKWLLRKEILISTVVKVFAFSSYADTLCLQKMEVEKAYNQERLYLSESNYFSSSMEFVDKIIFMLPSKAYSFAAILYYTHILGDIENNSTKTANTRISLNELCIDLTKHLNIVFGSKLNSDLGKSLKDSLSSANNPRSILDLLQSTLQELLPEEKFYSDSNLAKEIYSAVGF